MKRALSTATLRKRGRRTARFLIANPRLEISATHAESITCIFLIANRLQFFNSRFWLRSERSGRARSRTAAGIFDVPGPCWVSQKSRQDAGATNCAAKSHKSQLEASGTNCATKSQKSWLEASATKGAAQSQKSRQDRRSLRLGQAGATNGAAERGSRVTNYGSRVASYEPRVTSYRAAWRFAPAGATFLARGEWR